MKTNFETTPKNIQTPYGKATLNSGYYKITSTKEENFGKLLHRLVWEDHYQTKVPNGYVIHHINEYTYDNRIQNLQCVKHGIHSKHHHIGRRYPLETRKKMSENHADVSGKNNPNFGKKHSVATRNLMSKNHADVTGSNHGKYRHDIGIEKVKELFDSGLSMNKISEIFSCSDSTIKRRLLEAQVKEGDDVL